MMTALKSLAARTVKNAIGWRTNRKIVVIEVDDYGNVRVDSKAARERMTAAGLPVHNRYDYYDSLETTEDLEMLFETLSSVKDINGNSAVFTALALPVNMDYERMRADNCQTYYYEPLPATFAKLKGYESTWALWHEGMQKGLISPEFHGREHLNLKLLTENLAKKDPHTLLCIENRSYTAISSPYKTISFAAAFDFDKAEELPQLKAIMADGLEQFEKVYGLRATHFNPPGGRENTELHSVLADYGVRSFIMPLVHEEHLGEGKYGRKFYYAGKRNALGQVSIVRNCVFEPGDVPEAVCIAQALQQIEMAFRFGCPAILSSHRVNFCGHIDPAYRAKSLKALSHLLKQITLKWPDVEFHSTSSLTKLLQST